MTASTVWDADDVGFAVPAIPGMPECDIQVPPRLGRLLCTFAPTGFTEGLACRFVRDQGQTRPARYSIRRRLTGTRILT